MFPVSAEHRMGEIPEWISAFTDVIARTISPLEAHPPLGCHCHFAEGVWEISLFAGDTEIVGGERDGERVPSRFVVDIMPLMSQFSAVYDCTWQPERFDRDDELGSHLSIIGLHAEQLVCLRILSRVPDRFPPGRRTNAWDGACHDVW